MQPTGDYTTVNKKIIRDEYVFRKVKEFSPESPLLVIEFGKYPISKERRNIKERGQKKITYRPLALAVGIGGIATAIVGWDDYVLKEGDGGEPTRFYSTRSYGVLAALIGSAYFFGADEDGKWLPITKFTTQNIKIKNVESFQPLCNERIKIFSPTIEKEWILVTDEKGQISVDISVVSSLVKQGASLDLKVNSENFRYASNIFTIPSSFFSDLKTYYATILPPDLYTKLNFNDASSLKPNQMIDGAEKSYLIATIVNSGEGKALGVKLKIKNNYQFISIDSNIQIGTIEPGRKIEKRIPLDAAMDVTDGKANIHIETKEKRGYDARPVKLVIPVRHLDKPILTIDSYRLNDSKSGKANGDGDGIPENGETIELQIYVKNSGVGPALGTKLELAAINQGINVLQNTINLGEISPNQTKQGNIVFSIPRAFTTQQLDFQLRVKDKIGASEFSKSYAEAFGRRAPVLAYDYRLLDNRGVELNNVENGGSFNLEVTPKNNGSIDAENVTISVNAGRSIYFPEKTRSLTSLAAGNLGVPVRFNFSIPRSYKHNKVNVELRLSQKEFPGLLKTLTLPVSIKKPVLNEKVYITTSNMDDVIMQGEQVTVTVNITNNGDLDAEDVKVRLNLKGTGIDYREKDPKSLGTIPANDMRQAKFDFFVMNSASPGVLPVSLTVTQSDGFANISKSLSYDIKEAGAIVVAVTGDETKDRRHGFAGTIVGKQPPTVTIVTPTGNKAYKNPVQLTIVITDDKPLMTNDLEICVNERLQTKEQGLRAIVIQKREQVENEGKKLQLVRSVFLEDGENSISASIHDSDNELGKDEVKLKLMTERADIWAVVVGVSKYQHSELNLKSANNDAQAFKDFLTSPAGGSVPSANIKFLIDEKATLRNVKSALNQTLKSAFEEDMIILYFACHGVPENDQLYLLPYDSDPTDLFSTALPQTALESLLTRSVRTNKVVMFADACHAGALGLPKTRASRAAITNKLFSEIAQAKNGMAILAAASANEFAQEDQKWDGGHGVFTYYLLEGLKGKADEDNDGLVRTEELFQYVRREVAKSTRNKQNPAIIDRGYDRMLPLGVVR